MADKSLKQTHQDTVPSTAYPGTSQKINSSSQFKSVNSVQHLLDTLCFQQPPLLNIEMQPNIF